MGWDVFCGRAEHSSVSLALIPSFSDDLKPGRLNDRDDSHRPLPISNGIPRKD